MNNQRDRVLFIDQNQVERQILSESALRPYGYDVIESGDGNEALALITTTHPDVILLDLSLTGVTSTDILAALNARELPIPVILIGNEGEERIGLHAFRLGAKDFLFRPVRETELIQVLERALTEVRFQRGREALLENVRSSEQNVKNRLREMYTLMGMGKTVTSLTNLSQVFEHVLRASLQLGHADIAGIYLRNEQDQLILRAAKNLSPEHSGLIGGKINDDLAEMVMNARETLIAANERGWKPLSPLESSAKAVIYAPLVVHDSSLGLLWIANRARYFEPHFANLMTAMADYASIALVNSHLFSAMQERTKQLESAYMQLKQQLQLSEDEKGRQLAINKAKPIILELQTSLLSYQQLSAKWVSGSHRAAADVINRQINDLISLLRPYWP